MHLNTNVNNLKDINSELNNIHLEKRIFINDIQLINTRNEYMVIINSNNNK